jgi:hypothetical protein
MVWCRHRLFFSFLPKEVSTMTPLAVRFRFLALLISLVLPVVGAGPAQADVIVQYAFPLSQPPESRDRTGPEFAPTTVDPNAIATDISLSDTLPDSFEPWIADRDPPYGRPVLRIDPCIVVCCACTPEDAVDDDAYFQFTVAVNPGLSLALDSLVFFAARGGVSTPRGWVLRSDVDGFASNIDTQEVPTQRPELTPFLVDLSGPAFQGLSAVTFRIYTYITDPGTSVDYVDVTLNGMVVP